MRQSFALVCLTDKARFDSVLVFWLISLTQMVRYDSVDGKCFDSFLFWFNGCSLACELFDLRF